MPDLPQVEDGAFLGFWNDSPDVRFPNLTNSVDALYGQNRFPDHAVDHVLAATLHPPEPLLKVPILVPFENQVPGLLFHS